MKPMKRLKASLQHAEFMRGKVRLQDWLPKQTGSTRRGVSRGTFKLPEYVIP